MIDEAIEARNEQPQRVVDKPNRWQDPCGGVRQLPSVHFAAWLSAGVACGFEEILVFLLAQASD
jgi:hypothetical protein